MDDPTPAELFEHTQIYWKCSKWRKCSKPFWGSPKVCLRWTTPSTCLVSKALQRDAWEIPEVWETFRRTSSWFWKPVMVLSHRCHTAFSTKTCGSVWQNPVSPCLSPGHTLVLSAVLFMPILQKGVFESIFTKNCVTSRVSNWWNLRRKDFQYKACPVIHYKIEPNFINSALQIRSRPHWHFQNQTGTRAPASTLPPELQHILPKQKSKQAKKLRNLLFHSTWCLYNQMLFNIPAVALCMGLWKRHSQSSL